MNKEKEFRQNMLDLLDMLIKKEIPGETLYEFVGMLEHLKSVALRHMEDFVWENRR